MRSFDELIEFLLDEVALCGEKGASALDFQNFVEKFYEHDVTTLDHSVVDPVLSAPVVDRKLVEKAWGWLTAHPDIWIGKNGKGNVVSFEEAEAREMASDAAANAANAAGAITAITVENDENEPTGSNTERVQQTPSPHKAPSSGTSLRIFTSQERIWQAVTGHGIDLKRVPAMEFQVLSAIAGAGPLGITQPDIVKSVGQDKRSVPKRTDKLAQNGYIIKKVVYLKGQKTSLCTHIRFAKQEERAAPTARSRSAGDVFIDGKLVLDHFLDYLVERCNDGSIPTSNLVAELGVEKKKWERVMVWKCLDRLEIIGIIQRFRASIQISQYGKKLVPSIKVLRQPTEEDRKRYHLLTNKERKEFREKLEAQDAVRWANESDAVESARAEESILGNTSIVEGDMDIVDDVDETTVGQELHDKGSDQHAQRQSVARWDPDIPYPNVIYDAVHAAGKDGLSSADVRQRTYGDFYQRSFDNMLGRLSDDWEHSQPKNLMHLALVRDTTIVNRTNLYLYRTYPNFEKAVEAGDAEWDAVRTGKKTTNSMTTPKLDRWGFSVVSTADLLKADGSASLTEIYKAVGPGKERTEYSGPVLEKDENGNDLIVWPLSATRGRPGKRKRMDSEDVTPAPTPSKVVGLRTKLGDSRNSATNSARVSTQNKVYARPETVKGMSWQEYNRQYREKRIQEKLVEKRTAQIRRYAEWLVDQAEKTNQQQPDAAPLVNQAPSGMPSMSQSSTSVKIPKKRGRPRKDDGGNVRKKQRLADSQENNESLLTLSPLARNNVDSSPIASARPTRINAEQKKRREERIEELIPQLSDVSRCGVHIDPPGSRPHLEGVAVGRGRSRRGCVIVFKFAWLKELEWFRSNPGTHWSKELHGPDNSATLSTNISGVVDNADNEIRGPAVAEEDHVSAGRSITPFSLGATQTTAVDSGDICGAHQRQTSAEVITEENEDSALSDWLIDFPEDWEMFVLGNESHLDTEKLQSLARGPCSTRSKKKRRGRKAKRRVTAPKPFDVTEFETATVDITTEPQEVIVLDDSFPQNLENSTRESVEVDADAVEHMQGDDKVEERVDNEEQPIAQDIENYDLREHVTVSKRRKRGVGLGGGSLRAKRIAMILDIVDKCGGVFGGDTEIIRPFQDAQQALQPGTLTDRDTILKALKASVSDGKLRRVTFAFADRNGLPITKHLLLRPDVKFEDDVAVEFRKKMEETYPVQWIPGHVLMRKRTGIDAGAPRKKVISRYIAIEEEPELQPEMEAQWILDHRQRQEEMERRREERKLVAMEHLRHDKLDLPRTERGRLRRLERVVMDKQYKENKIKWKERKQASRAAAEVAQFEAEEATIPGWAVLDLRANPNANWITEEMQRQISSTQGLRGQALFEVLGDEQFAASDSTTRFHDHGLPKPWERFVEQSGLMAPVQPFHAPTGTFSTNFNGRINNKMNWPNAQAILDSWKYRHVSLPKGSRRSAGANAMVEPFEQLSQEELQEWQKEGYGFRLSNSHGSTTQPGIKQIHFVNYTLDHSHVTAKSFEPKESNHYAYRPGDHFTLYGQPNQAPPTDVTLVPLPKGRRIRPPAPRPSPHDSHGDFDSSLARRGAGTVREEITSRGTVAQTPLNPALVVESAHKGGRKSGPKAPRTRRPAKGDPTCVITPDAAKHLLFAVIAIRSLAGGPSQTTHWAIINSLFENYPNFDPTSFRKRWAIMLQYHKEIVDRVEAAFQNAFLAAYDNNEVPRLDNEHPENYDWNFIVKWARDNVMIDSRDLHLPAGREEFEKTFVIQRDDRNESEAALREGMYREMSTLIYRERVMKDLEFSVSASTSTLKPSGDDFDAHDLTVAKSWVRASIATPQSRYNAGQCLAKLNSLGRQLLSRAMAELQEEKMIVHNFRGRDHSGERNYHLSEQYTTSNPKRSTLVRQLQQEHFVEAVAFKRKLDQLFARENEDERVFIVPELVRDGEILCITELMAYGRVRIVDKLPEINSTLGEQSRRITVWGGLSGDVNYNYSGGKHVDKEALKCDVEVRPTEEYIMGFPMEEVVKSVEPPMVPKGDRKGRERIPFWVDVHGGFLKENWENVLLAVVNCVAVRAASTPETITKSFKGIMWEWEITMVMDWLMEVRLARWGPKIGRNGRSGNESTIGLQEKSGMIANEWWWTLLAGTEAA